MGSSVDGRYGKQRRRTFEAVAQYAGHETEGEMKEKTTENSANGCAERVIGTTFDGHDMFALYKLKFTLLTHDRRDGSGFYLDLDYQTNENGRLRPFLAVGIGTHHFQSGWLFDKE
jgi:hypothetical protein